MLPGCLGAGGKDGQGTEGGVGVGVWGGDTEGSRSAEDRGYLSSSPHRPAQASLQRVNTPHSLQALGRVSTHASASGLLSNLPLLAQGLRTGCFLQSPHMSWLQCHFLREPSVDLLELSAPHASFMTTVFQCTCDPFTSQAPTKHRLRESQHSIRFHILPCPPCLHSTGH